LFFSETLVKFRYYFMLISIFIFLKGNILKKMYLIDAMSLVFRAYHAMSRSNLTSGNGEPTGAVFGFINTITSLIEKDKPDYLAVVFDTHEPTFRHQLYDAYKANRDAFPEDLIPQVKRIKDFLIMAGIPQIELHGYEADDIIATLAKESEQFDVHTYCLTMDKDYYQLVSDGVSILKPSRKGEEIDIVSFDGVKDKFGVKPEQVIEVQALIGDSVDNIPGVKGVGEKTAIPLIQEYGNLEGLYKNIDKIKSRAVKEKLIADKEMAFLSRELVTLKIDTPIALSFADCVQTKSDFVSLDKLFSELGFRTLRQKWHNKAVEIGVAEIDSINTDDELQSLSSLDKKATDYRLIDNIDDLKMMLDYLESFEEFAFDIETSSLNRDKCSIVGMSISAEPNKAFYIAVEDDITLHSLVDSENLFDAPRTEKNNYKAILIEDVISLLKPFLESTEYGKIGQNIKFDAYIMKRYGVNITPVVFDTMLASYVLNPDNKHGMDELAKKWLGYDTISISELIGEKRSSQKSMADLPPSEISDYACEDADITLKLQIALKNELVKDEKLYSIAKDIEFPSLEVLLEMEANGVAIDIKALSELSLKISKETEVLTKLIHQEAGEEFNIDSPKQLGSILYEKMLIPTAKKTKTGYSVDAETLGNIAESYPIAKHILEYRTLAKLNSTYVSALPKLVNSSTGRIHTTFNQTIASTGRLSSTDPNLQNIPIRSELGKMVRKAFIPGNKKNVILSADYSQIELRIMAAICNDETLKEAFAEGKDIHSATAAKIYSIPLEQVDSDKRRIAKTVNFGIMYGLGSFGLASRLGLQRSYAKQIIDNYFTSYPGIKKYIEQTIEFAQTNGYAETLLGRRRYFPEINGKNRVAKTAAERAAINMPIQGTASDMIKLAMIKVSKALKAHKMKSLMILQVHDELVFETPENEIEEVRDLIRQNMIAALSLGDIPVVVDIGIGNNWYEAH